VGIAAGIVVVVVVFAIVAQVEKKSVVDTVTRGALVVANEEMIPSLYFVAVVDNRFEAVCNWVAVAIDVVVAVVAMAVAIVAADILDLNLVVVASFIPYLRNTIQLKICVSI
jgi:hypothetical protein